MQKFGFKTKLLKFIGTYCPVRSTVPVLIDPARQDMVKTTTYCIFIFPKYALTLSRAAFTTSSVIATCD